ncbi:MAG: hypothetical protein V3T72_11400 [Thermoanaerobaculia bacterium]
MVVPKPVREQPFLLSPAAGYPLLADADLERRTAAIFERLRIGDDLDSIAAEADRLLAEAAGYHPAAVLRAQVDTLRQDFRQAAERLSPIADELPDYLACQVLRGHVAELLGELQIAFEAFSAVAVDSEHAGARAAEIRPRAVEIVFHRLEESLQRGRLEEAEDHRRWLDEWVADEHLSLRAAFLILAASGDLEGELEAVCRLAELDPIRDLLQRCGELQVEVGEPRTGLEIFERLVAEHPGDVELLDRLENAKFRWRLELLPPAVGDLDRKSQLERADLATLLFWLVPQVRSSQISNPPIATDILESPRRDEILRVVSLGLMRIDEDLHRFDPEAPVIRLQVLAALLRLLETPDQRFACLDGTAARALAAATGWVCDRAVRCGLITESAECLPRASISGSQALELFRQSLSLLGSGGDVTAAARGNP